MAHYDKKFAEREKLLTKEMKKLVKQKIKALSKEEVEIDITIA